MALRRSLMPVPVRAEMASGPVPGAIALRLSVAWVTLSGMVSILFRTGISVASGRMEPSMSALLADVSGDCKSSGDRSQMTTDALATLRRARSMPSDSMGSSVVRIPAVSMKRKVWPSMSMVSSIVSRVVPGMSLTMARSVSSNVLSSRDLPTFGRPIMATGMPSRRACPDENVEAMRVTML